METNYQSILAKFYEREKRMPSYSEMMDLFGYKSKNAVARLVTKLIAAGVVAKDRLGRLVPSESFGEIPVVGLVKAGIPDSADTLSDTLNLEQYLLPKKERSFMLEVSGDSMIEAHIEDGDMVIAERATTARDGDIVIALVDGESTMKYFRTKGNKAWLEPANKNYKPIYPERELTITAIVKAVIRKY